MKKIVFAFCMMFGAVVMVNAQDSTSTTSPTDPTSTSQQDQTQPSTDVALQDEGRVKIKSQDLPDAVKSALEGQEYRGWLVNSAYKVDAAANASTGQTSSGQSGQVGAEQSGSTTSTDSVSVNQQGNQPQGDQGQTTDVSGMGSHNQEVFIVELKNGAQTKTVRFDKDGKKLDDEGMNDDQK